LEVFVWSQGILWIRDEGEASKSSIGQDFWEAILIFLCVHVQGPLKLESVFQIRKEADIDIKDASTFLLFVLFSEHGWTTDSNCPSSIRCSPLRSRGTLPLEKIQDFPITSLISLYSWRGHMYEIWFKKWKKRHFVKI
jgi:hypothetical protein